MPSVGLPSGSVGGQRRTRPGRRPPAPANGVGTLVDIGVDRRKSWFRTSIWLPTCARRGSAAAVFNTTWTTTGMWVTPAETVLAGDVLRRRVLQSGPGRGVRRVAGQQPPVDVHHPTAAPRRPLDVTPGAVGVSARSDVHRHPTGIPLRGARRRAGGPGMPEPLPARSARHPARAGGAGRAAAPIPPVHSRRACSSAAARSLRSTCSPACPASRRDPCRGSCPLSRWPFSALLPLGVTGATSRTEPAATHPEYAPNGPGPRRFPDPPDPRFS